MPTPNATCWGTNPEGVARAVWLAGRFITSLATLHPVNLKVDDVKAVVVGTANAWPTRERTTEKERVDKNMASKTKKRKTRKGRLGSCGSADGGQ